MSRHSPCPIDIHVAKKLRQRREELSLSQTAVAMAVGVTYQQIQKYERGRDRISAGRLYKLADALECKVECFFDGLDTAPNKQF